MARARTWTDERYALMEELRKKRRKWKEIGQIIGVSGALCCKKYLEHKAKIRIAERRKQLDALGPRKPPPASLPASAASDQPQRYFSDIDADLRTRIARQGLTAGVFGDPPPGRSALDQRGQR